MPKLGAKPDSSDEAHHDDPKHHLRLHHRAGGGSRVERERGRGAVVRVLRGQLRLVQKDNSYVAHPEGSAITICRAPFEGKTRFL